MRDGKGSCSPNSAITLGVLNSYSSRFGRGLVGGAVGILQSDFDFVNEAHCEQAQHFVNLEVQV